MISLCIRNPSFFLLVSQLTIYPVVDLPLCTDGWVTSEFIVPVQILKHAPFSLYFGAGSGFKPFGVTDTGDRPAEVILS